MRCGSRGRRTLFLAAAAVPIAALIVVASRSEPLPPLSHASRARPAPAGAAAAAMPPQSPVSAAASLTGQAGAPPSPTSAPATASGTFAPINIADGAAPAFHPTPHYPSAGPAPNPRDLAFFDDQHGMLVSGMPHGIRGAGQIQLTDDGGQTWRTVWNEDGVYLSAISLVDEDTAFVAGLRYLTDALFGAPSSPLLLRSDDRGRSWAEVPIAIAPEAHWPFVHLQFVTAAIGFALAGAIPVSVMATIWKTIDGGQTWSPRVADMVPESFFFLDAETGYAAGLSRQDAWGGQIWRTDDGGDSWQPSLATPVPFGLYAIAFLDDQHGFAAGGILSKGGGSPAQAILGTQDGGATWAVLYQTGAEPPGGGQIHPAVDIHFDDLLHGWYVVGGCEIGQNGPCGGAAYATDDGGASWRDTGQAHVDRLVAPSTGHAWAIRGESSVLERTDDGGRTWIPVAQHDGVAISSVQAYGPSLLLATDAGRYLSQYGAAATPFAPPMFADERPDSAVGFGPKLTVATGATLRVSGDGGQTWSTFAVPSTRQLLQRITAAAFASANDGIAIGDAFGCSRRPEADRAPVYGTTDGGQTWLLRGQIPLGDLALSSAPGLAVATGFSSETDRPCAEVIALSHDGGASWQIETLPPDSSCGSPAAASAATVWLICSTSDRASFTSTSALLVSRDAGQSWLRLPDGVAGPYRQIAAASGHELWLLGADNRLWHSLDDGATFDEVLAPLPFR